MLRRPMPKAQTRTLLREGDGGLVRRTTLPGGLRVITEQVPGRNSPMSVLLFYRLDGELETDSAPPAMTTVSMPALMLAAAPCTAASSGSPAGQAPWQGAAP